MSDRFDPEAWPYPEDDEPAGPGTRQTKSIADGQDDFQSLDFDKPQAGANPAGYVDPYSDAPYSDTGFDDYGYGDLGGAQPGAGTYDYGDAPSPGYGAPDGLYGPPGAAPVAGAGSIDDTWDDDSSTLPPDPYGGDREPYGSADEGFGYDNDPTAYTASSHRASGSYDDDDPYGSQDAYDDDDDDDYDREPERQGGGLGRKLLAALAILFLIGAAVLGAMYFLGGNDNPTPPADELTDITTAPTEETVPNETVAPTTPEGQQTATIADAPPELVDGLNDALTGWGSFAVDGNLANVEPYFAAGGEQFKRFQAESEALRAAPPGGAPMQMTAADPTTAKVDENNWIVRANVTVARQGEETQKYNWEFRMVKSDEDVWQVATVRTF